MEAEHFAELSGLLCEPSRARMLWNLLDGRAYTATEIAVASDISASSASNHLARLLKANILKVETQGRHRYYSFARDEVAYVIESMANLADSGSSKHLEKAAAEGIRNCRTCYDHTAGRVAVLIADAFERKKFLYRTDKEYAITHKGWCWLAAIGIQQADLSARRRPVVRQCLDWSERRPHLAGQLGAKFLEVATKKKWFKPVHFSRELQVTRAGQQEMLELLEIEL